MDFATICRFKLPVTVIIFNNGGIYNNIGVNPSTDPAIEHDPAPTTLDLDARYEKMCDVFGVKGYYVSTPTGLASALKEALAQKSRRLSTCSLQPTLSKESGHIGYLNPTPLINYTV